LSVPRGDPHVLGKRRLRVLASNRTSCSPALNHSVSH
jgi:hypothetical protein